MPTRTFRNEPIDFYIDKLERGERFSFVGYSDAEWFCILGHRIGRTTGLGQILHGPTGAELLDILCRRWQDPSFLIAVPRCMWDCDTPAFVDETIPSAIDSLLLAHNLHPEFYERDMVLDNLAADAGLYPLIHELQLHNPIIVGNRYLNELHFLNYAHHVAIPSPNLHMDPETIERIVRETATASSQFSERTQRPTTILVSAGLSSAILIDRLMDLIPSSTFIDCGSIWDAFVGVGGQREWRRRLYANPEGHLIWRNTNLYGRSTSLPSSLPPQSRHP